VRERSRVFKNDMMEETPGFDSRPPGGPTEGAAERVSAAMEDAALWLARLDSGSADEAAFERWRAADPAHAIAFARIAASWDSLDAAPVVAAPARRRIALSRRAALLSIGALAVAASGAGLSSRVLARERATTLVGERRTLRPGPGAQVDINTDSQLFWRLRGDRLTLWLEQGEVAVRVTPDGHSTVLHAGGLECSLRPGRYNARLTEERLELTTLEGLAEGRTASGRRVRAAGGELLQAGNGAALSRAASANALAKVAAWPRGEIVFEDVSLSEAVREYNRYLERKLVIGDPAVGALRIGGRFTSSDPADFLAALETVLPVQVRPTADGVLLTLAG